MWNKIKAKEDILHKISRYLTSGFTVLAFNLCLYSLLVNILQFWYLLASVIAFILSFFLSFFLQKLWTFKNLDADKIPHQLLLFFTASVGGLIFNTVAIYFLVEAVGLQHFPSQIISVGIAAAFNFYLYGFIFH